MAGLFADARLNLSAEELPNARPTRRPLSAPALPLAGGRRPHDRIDQPVPSDRSIETGAGRNVVPDTFGQLRVELCDVIWRVGGHRVRHIAVPRWDGQLGQFGALALCPM